MDPQRGVGVARVFLDLPKLRLVMAGGRVASDSGRAKQRSHGLAKSVAQELLSRTCV